MKLYIRQRVFSLTDKFTVCDETGRDVWIAECDFFAFGHRMRVYDTDWRQVAMITQKLLTLLPRYVIIVPGREFTLVKEFTLLSPRYRFQDAGWIVKGDFLAHEYEMLEGQRLVMAMSKRWFTWGDSYELTIPDRADELSALCVALAIDCVTAPKND